MSNDVLKSATSRGNKDVIESSPKVFDKSALTPQSSLAYARREQPCDPNSLPQSTKKSIIRTSCSGD